MTGEPARRSGRWHREPLVWLVLAIPAASVIMGAVLLVLANATWDGLVADDYYRRGLQIDRSLARDAEAARLGLGATLAFPAPGVVEVRVEGAAATPADGRLTLEFSRAGRAGDDVRADAVRGAGGVWRAAVPELAPGKWYVELGNARWRLAAPVWMPAAGGEIALRAPAAPRGS